MIRPRSAMMAGGCTAVFLLVIYQTNLLQHNPKRSFVGVCDTDAINSVDMEQDDPCLLKIIRENYLRPPSKLPLQLNEPDTENPSMGQTQQIVNILGNQRGGFFIECGALDGELRSNSLYLERSLGWDGVLIEGDPENFAKVVRKQRKAWTVPACLSKVSRPKVVGFKQLFNQGRISEDAADSTGSQAGVVPVQCFPIYSILAALNRTTVDYFSLDIEGDELSVLKTIPWDSVDIRTLSVEFIHDKEGKVQIREFMEARGYRVVTEVTNPMWLANDFIFAKNSIPLPPSMPENAVQ